MTLKRALLRGVSLIELLVTLSIAIILLVIAAPSFIDVLASNTATGYANDLLADLNYARSEAITRGTTVVVCKGNATAIGSGCTTGNWEDGWKVFVCNQPCASPYQVLATADVLRVHSPLSSNWTLRGNTNVANYVLFKSTGLANNNGTLVFCQGGVLNSGNQTRSSAVTVLKTGRVRVLPYNSNGVPLDYQNNALTSCNV